MKALIGIATYKRPEKLKRLLLSLKRQTYQNYQICVVFDNNDNDSMLEIAKEFGDIKAYFVVSPTQLYVIGCWNYMHRLKGYDAHLMLCDDVELYDNCLETALRTLKNAGDDSVIGLTQKCPGISNYSYKPYGQTLMGRTFIDRYKDVNHQVCCPYYTHFYQDQEMWEYAIKNELAIHDKDAILNHYHPAFKKEEMDETHHIVRVPDIFIVDRLLFNKRQSEGKLWGETWEK